ncbi:MAG: hypothetical protein ABL924_15180 [Methyloglobulus sp.]
MIYASASKGSGIFLTAVSAYWCWLPFGPCPPVLPGRFDLAGFFIHQRFQHLHFGVSVNAGATCPRQVIKPHQPFSSQRSIHSLLASRRTSNIAHNWEIVKPRALNIMAWARWRQ